MGLGLAKVNYIMWWCFVKPMWNPCRISFIHVCYLVITPCRCFVKAMWKAVRGRLGLKKIVFKVTEKQG